jgi:hypothetical protein
MCSYGELQSSFITQSIKNPLSIYGQNVKIQCYALIDSFNPLQIKISKNPLVKLIGGYPFVKSQKRSLAQLSYTELLTILEQRGYTLKERNGIWDQCCKAILRTLLAIVPKMELLTKETF